MSAPDATTPGNPARSKWRKRCEDSTRKPPLWSADGEANGKNTVVISGTAIADLVWVPCESIVFSNLMPRANVVSVAGSGAWNC